jgi:hypothetical protein
MIAFLALEAAAWFAVIVALGGLMYGQADTPRFALAGIAVDLFALGMLAAALRQIVMARRVEYGEPVAVIQKQLEGLRVLRIRIIQWALPAGAVVWAPCAIVVSTT